MSIKWKEPAVPRTVVQAIVIDENHKSLLIHRSPTVRSAANVWSIPSGMQDIGEDIEQTIVRELMEEFSLSPLSISIRGIYENIAGDENAMYQYHWVVIVVVLVVDDITKLMNNEPDKHDITEIVPINFFRDIAAIKSKEFHPTLTNFLINDAYNKTSLESLLIN